MNVIRRNLKKKPLAAELWPSESPPPRLFEVYVSEQRFFQRQRRF